MEATYVIAVAHVWRKLFECIVKSHNPKSVDQENQVVFPKYNSKEVVRVNLFSYFHLNKINLCKM